MFIIFFIQKDSRINNSESLVMMMAAPTVILEDPHMNFLDKFIFTIICSFNTTKPLKINVKNLIYMSGQPDITTKDVINSLRSLSDEGWIELASFGKFKYVVNINFTKVIEKEIKVIKQNKLDF